MKDFQPFRYMRWAKAHAGAPDEPSGEERRTILHLGQSGLPPPEELLLARDLSADLADAAHFPEHASPDHAGPVDLAQRGADMPPEARAKVALRLGVAPERVMLTLGSSHALYLACASLLGPGETCLVESPDYEVLHLLPLALHAGVERFERRMETGYRIGADVCARVRSLRPALTIVTNPHNPSGAALSLDELGPLADAVADAGGVLLVDEVYLEYFADAPDRSAQRLGEHVLTVASFTKAFGLGAVRFGWLCGSAARIERAVAYNDFISVLYPTPLAQIGMAALAKLTALQARAEAISARGRAILSEWVASRADVAWHRPDAGVMAFLRLLRVTDAHAFCERLVREREVQLVPGDFFGAPGCVRIGYGAHEEVLREGLRRLGMALDAA